MTAPATTAGPAQGRVAGLDFLVLGSGGPVTLFLHGLAGSVADTRVLARTVTGTRVLLTSRGHGGSAPFEAPWDYDLLAADVAIVADHVGADRAVGVSLGAGTLLHLAAAQPDRFAKLALVLPAALDRARGEDGAALRLRRLADGMTSADVPGLTELLLEEVPAALRDSRGARALMARRARELAGAVPPWPRPAVRPVDDATALRHVSAAALVVAQEDDPLHPVAIASEVADALPLSELVVLPAGGVFWTAGRTVQTLLATHLEEDA
jgi:pimeloyl-ACP methyl ester carboxylesterase